MSTNHLDMMRGHELARELFRTAREPAFSHAGVDDRIRAEEAILSKRKRSVSYFRVGIHLGACRRFEAGGRNLTAAERALGHKLWDHADVDADAALLRSDDNEKAAADLVNYAYHFEPVYSWWKPAAGVLALAAAITFVVLWSQPEDRVRGAVQRPTSFALAPSKQHVGNAVERAVLSGGGEGLLSCVDAHIKKVKSTALDRIAARGATVPDIEACMSNDATNLDCKVMYDGVEIGVKIIFAVNDGVVSADFRSTHPLGATLGDPELDKSLYDGLNAIDVQCEGDSSP